jgi:hypothetical protein
MKHALFRAVAFCRAAIAHQTKEGQHPQNTQGPLFSLLLHLLKFKREIPAYPSEIYQIPNTK